MAHGIAFELIIIGVAAVLSSYMARSASAQTTQPFAIAIHGGAGTITRETMTPEKEQAYRRKLQEALHAGHSILGRGGSSMDACVAAVKVMEDSPLFNAGKGAVYTADGKHEMDACVMDGATLKAGAVAAVSHVKNPIELARLVMDKSPHVLLVGEGAEKFAQECGVEFVESSYFDTPERLEQLRRAKAKQNEPASAPALSEQDKHGTVGAVALDQHGNLAAATSTGGMTNKRFGRVGDSPLVGAGTYADNQTCAISATGHGEYLMRLVTAHEIASMMRYGKMSLSDASDRAVNEELKKLGGTGGLIGIDHDGNIVMPFNTEGMYRGCIDTEGNLRVEIYR